MAKERKKKNPQQPPTPINVAIPSGMSAEEMQHIIARAMVAAEELKEQRKIEHVHYFAVKQRGISSVGREKSGDFRRHRIVEDDAIKNAVEDIPGSSSCDQRQTNKVACRDISISTYQTRYIPYQSSYSQQTEKRQKKLASDLHSECHSVVFDKQQLEP